MRNAVSSGRHANGDAALPKSRKQALAISVGSPAGWAALAVVVIAGLLASIAGCSAFVRDSVDLPSEVRGEVVDATKYLRQNPSGELWSAAPVASQTAATWLPAMALLLVSGEVTREYAAQRLVEMVPLIREQGANPWLAAYALHDDLGSSYGALRDAILESAKGQRAIVLPRIEALELVDSDPGSSVSQNNPLCVQADEQIRTDPAQFSITATQILLSKKGTRGCSASGLGFTIPCDAASLSIDLVLDITAIYPARAANLNPCVMKLLDEAMRSKFKDGVGVQNLIQTLGFYAWLIVRDGVKSSEPWTDTPLLKESVLKESVRVDRERGRTVFAPAAGGLSTVDNWILARVRNSLGESTFNLSKAAPEQAALLAPPVSSAGCAKVRSRSVRITTGEAADPPDLAVERFADAVKECERLELKIDQPAKISRAFATVAAALVSCARSGEPGTSVAIGGDRKLKETIPKDLLEDPFVRFAMAFLDVPADSRCAVLGYE